MRETNVAFTHLVKVQGRLREFDFRQRPTGNYDVDVPDERGNCYFIQLVNEDGSWKINGGDLSQWIIEGELLLD